MKVDAQKSAVRRRPVQRRSQETVDAILEAVLLVLKREGLEGVTTNRIAETAGVSIGSVYQYFPDKRAIFAALHDRHVEEVGRAIDAALALHAESSFEDVTRALVEALVDAHGDDPALHELLSTLASNGASGPNPLETRLRAVFRLAIAARAGDLRRTPDLERALFVLPPMVEALAHAVALRRPARLSVAAAKEEAVRAVVSYLRAMPSRAR